MDGLGDLLTYISQLDVRDIDQLQSLSRSRTSAIPNSNSNVSVSDEDLALLYFVEEAQNLLNVAKDYNLNNARDAPTRSRTLLEELIAIEEIARRDREIAIALSEGREPPRYSPTPSNHHTVTEGSNDSVNPRPGEDRADSPPSSPVTSPQDVPADPLETCTACEDLIDGPLIYAPCGHAYDVGCLQTFFRKATVDESVFPPSCCGEPIPLDDVEGHVGSNLADIFRRKSIEFTTTDRVYCYQSTCSTFLGAATPSSSVITCPKCDSQTCSSCKEEAHTGRSCSAHWNQVVLDMAKQHGWQRCPGCHHLVELTYGCFHMQCVCKKQFCYLCAATWKECSCPQFAEERL